MKIILLGAAGFIGTNLAIQLSKSNNKVTLVDKDMSFFNIIKNLNLDNIDYLETEFSEDSVFDSVIKGQDIVYHLVSTTVPTTSNQQIAEELKANVIVTSKLLDACVREKIKKVIFISSGGTVYGKEVNCPLKENTPTNPISSYGVQKVTIEKLLYLYQYIYGLDYRIIRLANPYGPYQRPDGILGAVTTFTYKALKGDKIIVYGDGSVIRDFIFIDDAVRGILNIAYNDSKYRIFNLGSGSGISIRELLSEIKNSLECDIHITYREGRKVDVPINYLDISRYEEVFGLLNPVSLRDGIKKTAEFIRRQYNI